MSDQPDHDDTEEFFFPSDLTEESHVRWPLPSSREEALATYETLRAANPWLPDPSKISANRDLELTFGADFISTLTFTVYIELSKGSDQ